MVCVACRRETGGGNGYDEPGRGLAVALADRLAADAGISVEPVECLAVCKRPCTIALAGPGRWTYLVGDLDAARHLDEIVAAARAYHATGNGIIPWRERPAPFRAGVVARVPPLAAQE
jgi:predicted metal-binding protein